MTSERDIYERIVAHERRGAHGAAVQETLTLGLVHFYKWDRVAEREKRRPGVPIDPQDIQAFCDEQTEREVDDRRADALAALKEYVGRYQAGPNFWFGVGQGIIAAFFYSLILLAVYHLLKAGNLDLFTLLGIKTGTP